MANEPNTRGPMMVLVVGSLAIAGLIAWALTRQVDPAPLPSGPSLPASPQAGTSGALGTLGATGTPGTTDPAAVPASTQTVTADEAATVRRMAPEELKSLVDRGGVTVVDVRDAASFNSGHIPGAIHIPMTRVEAEVASLPKDKPIVTYCT